MNYTHVSVALPRGHKESVDCICRPLVWTDGSRDRGIVIHMEQEASPRDPCDNCPHQRYKHPAQAIRNASVREGLRPCIGAVEIGYCRCPGYAYGQTGAEADPQG